MSRPDGPAEDPGRDVVPGGVSVLDRPPRADVSPPGIEEGTSRRWRAPWAVGAVALALRSWMPGEVVRTVDEFNWVIRSLSFEEAIRSWNLAGAAAAAPTQPATRPGVTTMWTGWLARELVTPADRLWGALGLGAGPSGLRLAHLLVALWCSLGLVGFVLVARRLVGQRGALIAGGILAVEPLLVGHSAVLHTDALVTTYAGLAVVALVAAMEQANTADGATSRASWWRTPSMRLTAGAGLAAAIAALTKVNAVALIGAAVVVLVGQHARQAGAAGSRGRSGTAHLGVFTVVAGAVFVALWPAVWVDPLAQLGALFSSGRLAGEFAPMFFLGRVIDHVDRRFYFVAAWYRASPWLLVASLTAAAATVVAVVSRRPSRTLSRRVIASLSVPPLVYFAAIVMSAKQYDRYLLPLLPFVAIGVGVVVARMAVTFGADRWVGRAGWAALAAGAAVTASMAPFAISYVDPLVGGQRAAVTKIDLGWGEGIETVLARTDARTTGCPTIASRWWLVAQPGCWKNVGWGWLDGKGTPPDYVLVAVDDRQQRRLTADQDAFLRSRASLVDALVIDGVAYVELWRPTA